MLHLLLIWFAIFVIDMLLVYVNNKEDDYLDLKQSLILSGIPLLNIAFLIAILFYMVSENTWLPKIYNNLNNKFTKRS